MKLSNIQVQNAKPKDKMYRLSDGYLLYLEIFPNGGRYWRMPYRYNNRRKQVAIGVYPTISIKDAREKCYLRPIIAKQRLIAMVNFLLKGSH